MGLTERHWFENEEPELTERQLEDAVYENKKAYERGYQKGYSDRGKEIIRCKYCENSKEWYNDKRRCFLWNENGIDVFDDGYCNYGKRKDSNNL